MTADADARLSAVEAKLSKLDDEIAKIRAAGGRREQERRAADQGQHRRREQRGLWPPRSRRSAWPRRRPGADCGIFAADLAIEQAAKQLVLTPETDRALIAEFVRDAARTAQGRAELDGCICFPLRARIS